MIINKSITLDLNRVQPLKVIRIHQGDVNSVHIVINVTNENKSVNLTGKAVMYDATISNILAEQDATGSISGSKITIPITKNMTAHSGLLKVDVKIIEGTTDKSILYTQTLTLMVERSVINGDTIIDASKTTIEQKLNNFELRLDGLVSEFYSKSEIDEKLESYYTKPQTDSLIATKVNHVFANDASEETCDRFTDWNTIYHLYINGEYQMLLNTSVTGCQYRFTGSGDVYYRTYNNDHSTFGEWSHLSSRIPSNTISNDMILKETIFYEKLADDYIRYFGNFNLDNLDSIGEMGIYTGTASDYRINTYQVYGNFTLLFTSSQLLFFTDCNRIFVRHRSKSGFWLEWNDISPGTNSDSGNFLTQETGTVGRVLLCVEEKNRSWCSSSNENDQRAITIECASDTYPPYAMNSKVYNKLIKLCIDICKRNKKKKLLWFKEKNKSLSYKPKSDEMVLTVHRWFANKSCPGDWLYSRLGNVAKEVTKALNTSTKSKENTTKKKSIDTIAREVINGKWGNGADRKKRLLSAGYDYNTVQKRVNELLR